MFLFFASAWIGHCILTVPTVCSCFSWVLDSCTACYSFVPAFRECLIHALHATHLLLLFASAWFMHSMLLVYSCFLRVLDLRTTYFVALPSSSLFWHPQVCSCFYYISWKNWMPSWNIFGLGSLRTAKLHQQFQAAKAGRRRTVTDFPCRLLARRECRVARRATPSRD